MNASPPARGALFQDRNFRWLFAGSLISQLGDQFTLIALPWLVLQLTGDTLVLGTVLAVMSVPRALFLLVGGAVVDRYSPKRVLMLTKHANTVLLGLLAALALSGRLELWMVYALALAIGLATAFSLPAATSIMPHVMPRELLGPANGLMMGVRQLSMCAGPLLAGLLIALSGHNGNNNGGAMRDATGLGLAFAVDAVSFLLSAWTLAKVATRTPAAMPAPAQQLQQSVWQAVGAGLRYCWNDASLRVCFCYWGAVAFFISGPIQVALPVLANQVGSDAAAFGLLAGGYGAGTLVGMVFSGIRPAFRIGSFGTTMLAFDGVIGLLFMPLGLIHATWQGVALLLVIGTLGGYLQVTVYTWLQRQVAPALLGRTMGLFMFIFMGIAPLSSAATGWLMRSVSLQQLFAVSGALLIAIVLATFAWSGMRAVADERAAASR
jgi:MFS family permease